MKNIKTYEIFNGGRVTNALVNDLNAGHYNWNKLMRSIAENEYKIFKELVKTENLEDVDKYGNTPLLLTSKNGRIRMVKVLIDNGANISHKNNQGEDFYDIAVNRFKFINGVKDWIEKEYPEFVMTKKYNI